MKKLNVLLLLFAVFMTTANANRNASLFPPTMQGKYPTQRQVWPTPMTPYRWPMATMPNVRQMQPQQRMMQTMPAFPTRQMMIPQSPYPYATPYRGMPQYPATAYSVPPVLRFPANQTFQQARPVYNMNNAYATPQIQPPPYARQMYLPAYPLAANTAQQQARPQYPMKQRPPFKKKVKKKKKPWGDTRYIWPDFYTDATGDMWDSMMNAPYDMGRMPGGWRAPSLSSPDPVTVGDAVTNQFPPVIDEIPNFMPFMNK